MDLTRLGVFFLLILGVFFLPFWINIILWLVFLYYAHNGYEVLFLGFLSDALYGESLGYWHGFSVVTLALAALLCIGMNVLKTRLIR